MNTSENPMPHLLLVQRLVQVGAILHLGAIQRQDDVSQHQPAGGGRDVLIGSSVMCVKRGI